MLTNCQIYKNPKPILYPRPFIFVGVDSSTFVIAKNAVIYEMLKEKGIFYLGIHKGKNSYRDNLGRLYVPREKQELSQELEKIGFSIKDISIRKSLSFEKKPIEIMHIFCQKI